MQFREQLTLKLTNEFKDGAMKLTTNHLDNNARMVAIINTRIDNFSVDDVVKWCARNQQWSAFSASLVRQYSRGRCLHEKQLVAARGMIKKVGIGKNSTPEVALFFSHYRARAVADEEKK